jgi:hypothetical protein
LKIRFISEPQQAKSMLLNGDSRKRAAVMNLLFLCALCVLCVIPLKSAFAGVLPDDRADLLYHRYQGGGVTIQGPSLLIRKTVAEKYSFTANYYQDMVSSASIDVQVSGASKYKEERTQYSFGFDYLRGKTTYSLNYTNSKENDYIANTYSFNISQDLFGDLTTISMGFSKGDDIVRRTIQDPDADPDVKSRIVDPSFEQSVDRWSYRVGVSQILTKKLITSLGLETITDEGYLNNPYRAYRYLDGSTFALATEKYPHTHTSNAASLNARYFLPYRAAITAGYRYYTDTWGIRADTAELGYIQPWKSSPLQFEASYRYYQQGHADFYSDLFPTRDFQNFMGRDKELATFDSQTIHLGATYEFARNGWSFIKKGSLNLFVDHMMFNFDDFRDARIVKDKDGNTVPVAPGAEPLYKYSANVFQLFVSIWF